MIAKICSIYLLLFLLTVLYVWRNTIVRHSFAVCYVKKWWLVYYFSFYYNLSLMLVLFCVGFYYFFWGMHTCTLNVHYKNWRNFFLLCFYQTDSRLCKMNLEFIDLQLYLGFHWKSESKNTKDVHFCKHCKMNLNTSILVVDMICFHIWKLFFFHVFPYDGLSSVISSLKYFDQIEKNMQ